MVNNMSQDFLNEEIRCDYNVSEEMKHIWKIQLDLISKLKDVCERHHLKYFLAGGSLIGAIRHQGFIPWDDDVDIFMPREDFQKLKELASYEFWDPYFLQTEESDPDIFLGGFARLRNTNTTHIEQIHLNHNANFGIWIDIIILDFIYEDVNKRKKQIRKIRHYQRLLHAKTYTEYNSFLGLPDILWRALKTLAYFCSRENIYTHLNKALTGCSDSKYVTSFTYHNYRRSPPSLFEKKDFCECSSMKFEQFQLPVPIGYDNILRLQYGDYMKLPPKDQRLPHHTGIIDPHVPYKSYLLIFDWFLKGMNDKTIVIFGAGKMLEHYLNHEGKKYPPKFIVDNDEKKWKTSVHGIPVKQPHSVLTVPRDNLCLLICSIHYREIAKQLRSMGIDKYYIYVQEIDWL